MTPAVPDRATAAPSAEVFHGFLDDAAIFPPGRAPLADAVHAHLAHRTTDHADLVGPLVVGAADLDALARTTVGLAPASLDLAVTAPSPEAAGAAAARARAIGAVRLTALEVQVPDGLAADDVVPALREASVVAEEGPDDAPDVPTVFVELPRDERRARLVAALAATPLHAKLRTGGVRADLHPDEAELAAAIVALVRAGVPFKATAGLHHATRNTDPATGFEQHGFLNLLVATDAALGGAEAEEVRVALADRDAGWLADRVTEVAGDARRWFCSFGTCSVADPIRELVDLGLLAPALVQELT